MKKIITYVCEICRHSYNNAEDALDCEARGLAKEIPIGTIYTIGPIKNSVYHDITFSIADNTNAVQDHHYAPGSRACRDNLVGRQPRTILRRCEPRFL